MKTRFYMAAFLVALLAVNACGSPDGGGTGGTGVARQTQSVGAIDAKTTAGNAVGLQLNGVHFDVSQATVTEDGAAATHNSLRPGMVVTVKGRVNADGTTGNALSVAYRNRVLGTLTAIDIVSSRLTVLGQAAHLSVDATLYDESTQAPIAITALKSGDYVEISGFIDAQNVIQVSYLARKPPAQKFEVKGNVAQLDTDAHRFRIGGLTVNYRNVEIETETDSLREGDAIEVAGRQYDAHAELLTADAVGNEANDLEMTGGADTELEGVVTTMPTANRFTIGSQSVQTDANTIVQQGVVSLNARVTARGTMDNNGVLVAHSIQSH